MTRVALLAVTAWTVLAACGGDDDDALPREVVDCSADDTICDAYGESGCSVDLVLVDAEGQVVGICGDSDESRVCSRHCEQDPDCPEGWTCQLPERCPGENTVRFCVPTQSELVLQGTEGCRAIGNPRVCGFF